MTTQLTLRSVVLVAGVVLGAVAGLVACDESPGAPVLRDDIGISLGSSTDSMHEAYAVGSRFRIHASVTEDGWRLESGDPAVLALTPMTDRELPLDHAAVALSEGATVVRVRDEAGEIVHEVGVAVRRPDRVALAIDGDPLGTTDPMPHVVIGGPVLVRVALFAGDTALAARNLLGPQEGERATIERTTMGIDEGVRVTATEAGPVRIAIPEVPGATGEVWLEGVSADAVRSVTLDRLDAVEDGRTGFVRARAADARGTRVYGPGFAWTLDGQPLPVADERADLFMYTQRAAATPRALKASFGTLEATTSVTLEGEPTLLRGSDLNCSTGLGAAPLGALAWAGVLVVVAVAALRRVSARRRAPKGQ